MIRYIVFLSDTMRGRTMEQQRQIRQLKQWKKITVWLLAMMLAVTMAVPTVSFAAGGSSSTEKGKTKANVTRQVKSKKSKKDKKSDKDKKSNKDKKSKKSKKQKKVKKKEKPPRFTNCYGVKVNKKGVMRCWWYDKKNRKKGGPQKDIYLFVTFKKGSKTWGTAVKKVGDSGLLYYFDKNGKGKKYTGWYRQGSAKYYFKNAKRYRGMKCFKKAKIVKKRIKTRKSKKSGKKNKKNKKTKKYKKVKVYKNTWYEFSEETGRYWRKIGDDADKKVQSYYSNTSYIITVSTKTHQTRIYKGSHNDWNRIFKWKCTTGKKSTPTIKGTFSVGVKGLHFDTGRNMRVWYYTQFCGNYFFHSVLYDRQPKPVRLLSGWLGIDRSHGCIRLKLENAKWIYDHVPWGSKVVIY